MLFDQLKFRGTKASGLRKNFRRNGDLADVVQIASDSQSLLPAVVETQLSADGRRQIPDAPLMPRGIRISQLAQSPDHGHSLGERRLKFLDIEAARHFSIPFVDCASM